MKKNAAMRVERPEREPPEGPANRGCRGEAGGQAAGEACDAQQTMTLEDLLALDRWGLLEEPDPDEQLLEDLRLLQLLEALQQPDAPHGHEHHRP